MNPRLATYVCPGCQSRLPLPLGTRPPTIHRPRNRARFFSTTQPKQKYALLTNRRLLRLSGPDASNFLHDLVPAKILGVGTRPIYTAFLTAHGRILNDAFIYPPSWTSSSEKSEPASDKTKAKEFEWWIEVDEMGLDLLVKHLKKHKLRSKFAMEKVDPNALQVLYRWPSQDDSSIPQPGKAGGPDPRPGMGFRSIIERDRVPPDLLQGEEEATLTDYTVHRMLNGLAEGQHEIISGHALPQESNIDFIGGIDFHKGCYLGQELTIRTHHTGVVRKRILPCQIYDASTSLPAEQNDPAYDPEARIAIPPPESNMSKASSRRKGRSTGKWLGGVGNIGLALCRLEMMTDIQLTADATNYDPNEEYKVQWGGGEDDGESPEVKVKPFVPAWVQQGIETSLKRKEKPAKRKDEEDEYEDEEE
jgi:folate-binding protein YgfZ